MEFTPIRSRHSRDPIHSSESVDACRRTDLKADTLDAGEILDTSNAFFLSRFHWFPVSAALARKLLFSKESLWSGQNCKPSGGLLVLGE